MEKHCEAAAGGVEAAAAMSKRSWLGWLGWLGCCQVQMLFDFQIHNFFTRQDWPCKLVALVALCSVSDLCDSARMRIFLM